MLGLADGPTPSKPDFPTGQALVLVLREFKTDIRCMITLLFTMGAHGWVPISLCFPAAARFIESVELSLEILILVGYFFNYRHQVLVGGGKLGIVGH